MITTEGVELSEGNIPDVQDSYRYLGTMKRLQGSQQQPITYHFSMQLTFQDLPKMVPNDGLVSECLVRKRKKREAIREGQAPCTGCTINRSRK